MRKSTAIAFSLMASLITATAAGAAELMPSFAGAPTGWSVDRYAPNSFSDVGNYQGLTHVLGIGISSADALNNRPAAYQSSFYNTQGESQAISGGAGSSISAQLYIPRAWDNNANGDVRTDMWGVMVDGTNSITDYPIIGFTNYGTNGANDPTFRIWDEDLNGGLGDWVDLSNTIDYGSWNSLSLLFTGTSYEYFVNGSLAFTDSTVDGSVAFSSVIMQAYNFGGDPSIVGANPVDYTAHWAQH